MKLPATLRGSGLAAAGAITFGGALVAAAAGFVLTIVVGRALGAVGAGVFFSVAAVFFIVSNVAELGADTALVWALPRLRALGREPDLPATLRVALVPVWLVSIACALLLFLLGPQLASILQPAGVLREQTEQAFRLVSPALAVAAPTAVALAGTRGLGKVLPFTLIGNVALPVARPVLVLLCAAGGLGLTSVLLAWSLPMLVAAAVAFLVLRRLLPHPAVSTAGSSTASPTSLPVRALAREFWTYATPRCFSAALEIALVWADVLLVTALSSARLAGIYAAASRFVTSGTLVESALRVAAGPRLSRHLTLGELREAERLNDLATVLIVSLSWPIYIPLAFYSSVVLHVFGEDFAAGAGALTLLAAVMAVRMLSGLSQSVLLMSGRSRLQLLDKIVTLTVNIVLNLALVPRFGLAGAATAWSIALLLDAGLAAAQVRYVIGVHWRLKRLALVSALAGGCYGGGGVLSLSTMGRTTVGLVVYVVTATAVYVPLLWAARRALGLQELINTSR